MGNKAPSKTAAGDPRPPTAATLPTIEINPDCLFPTWDNRVMTFFDFQKQLGRGGFGLVWKVKRLNDDEVMACKIMNKYKMKPASLQAIVHEVKYMRKLDHPNILKFKCGMETKRKLYLMTELLYGELDAVIGTLEEKDIQRIVLQILSALEYSHGMGVIHSDLKPENIMFADEDLQTIKLIDFGLSKSRKRWQWVSKVGGTPSYIAPECLSSRYTEAIDMWALGIIVYELCFGYIPFKKKKDPISTIQETTQGFKNEVRHGRGNWFPAEIPISEEAKNFIVCLLKVKPSERITASEGRTHTWFQNTSTIAHTATSLSFVLDSLLQKRNLNKIQQFLRQVVRVKGHIMHPFLTLKLDRLFKKYDTDEDGMLTWEDFRKAVDEFAEEQEHVTHRDVKILFAQIDTNHKGMIAYEDMVSWMKFQHLSKQDDRVWDAVMNLDTNKNGFVSKGDIEAFLNNQDICEKLSIETIKAVRESVKKGPLDYMEFIHCMEEAPREDPSKRRWL